MIQVDISNVWGQISLPDLLGLEKEIFDAHQMLAEGTGAGSEYRGWLELPVREETEELRRIVQAAGQIRFDSDVFVVIGTEGGSLGARAAIELLQGTHHNMGKGRGNPQIYFAGDSLSTRRWHELQRLLEGKDFSLCVISRSGTTPEPAIALRALRWMLERKYGTDEARRRIYAITDPEEGALRQMATEEGWEAFCLPPNVGGPYSVLTAAGLLPMAVAGIDIMELLRGAADAREEYDLRSFENPVWLYAAMRNLMYRNGKAIELLASFEPAMNAFGHWWQQLFARSESKDGKGMFPAYAQFTVDLHTLGQLIRQGERNLFETVLHFDPPAQKTVIGSDYKDLDGLNYLAGKTLDFVDGQAYLAVLAAHADSGTPVITVDCGELNVRKTGELFCFFELACAISAYTLGVDPFDQPDAASCSSGDTGA